MNAPAPVTVDAGIPTTSPTPVVSYDPVILPVPGRQVDLRLKVTAPATGTALPVILFSHGHGPATFINSSDGYGPLCPFWAARGFVVIQPAHQDANVLGLRETGDPDAPLYTRSRAQDMRVILDRLGEIEATVPGLAGRLDHDRVAAAGHSMGGLTTAMLCGAQLGGGESFRDGRVKVGVPIAAPGDGRDLAEWASTHYPDLTGTTFAAMTTPALVVVGENDHHPFFSARADWRSDAYRLSPGPKTLLSFHGAEHSLGGISMWDSTETTDENPARVAALRALVWAYLRSALYPGDPAWATATAALAGAAEPLGRTESR